MNAKMTARTSLSEIIIRLSIAVRRRHAALHEPHSLPRRDKEDPLVKWQSNGAYMPSPTLREHQSTSRFRRRAGTSHERA